MNDSTSYRVHVLIYIVILIKLEKKIEVKEAENHVDVQKVINK